MAEDPGKGKVFVTWLHGENNKAGFTEALCGLLAYDAIIRPELGLPRQIGALRGFDSGVNITGPRNDVVREFLKHPEAGEWHLSIDVDMFFPPDAVERLLEVADPESVPIVGGLCFGATNDFLWPTVYELAEDDEIGPHFLRAKDIPPNTLLRCTATGGAFLMVHRSAYEKIAAHKWPEDPYGHFPWFQETQLPKSPVGEDLTFCLRAGIAGLPVHVLTSLHIGHIKPHMLTAYKFYKQEGRLVDANLGSSSVPRSDLDATWPPGVGVAP